MENASDNNSQDSQSKQQLPEDRSSSSAAPSFIMESDSFVEFPKTNASEQVIKADKAPQTEE